jgi:carbamoyltransferase
VTKKIIWGMTGNSHDASIAGFTYDGETLTPKWAKLANNSDVTEELIQGAIENVGYPDQVVWYEKPLLKTLRQWRAGQGWLLKENNIKQYLAERNLCDLPIVYTKHHHSHAAYAYYTQPYADCAIVCLDSIGEFETLTMWKGDKDWRLTKVYSQNYPHSLGLFYSAMVQRTGGVPQQDEHLLAALGDPVKEINSLVPDIYKDILEIQDTAPFIKMKQNLHKGCKDWRPDLKKFKDRKRIAAATQSVFEDCISHLSSKAVHLTGSPNLALAGGGAMNKVAVDKIRNQWHNVHVPKNPGDPGSAIGAVLARYNQRVDIDGIWETTK